MQKVKGRWIMKLNKLKEFETQLRLESKFWAKVNKQGPVHPVLKSRCWLWTASKSNGYGQFQGSAHRYSWTIHYGEITDGLHVCHKCDNPACIRPEHLFIGSQKDNMTDAKNKGRMASGDRSGARLYPENLPRGDKNGTRRHPETVPKGETHTRAKLTEVEVIEIRETYDKYASDPSKGLSKTELGKKYGVSLAAICLIIRRINWKHI